jgi:hypothetical protein
VGPPGVSGAANYRLDILPSASAYGGGGGPAPGEGNATSSGRGVAARLWFLDSLNRGCGLLPGRLSWGCVAPDTLGWLQAQAARLPPVPSAAVIHIPIPEFKSLWNPGGGQTFGVKAEVVCCPLGDVGGRTGGALSRAGVSAVFSGHDHGNSYWGQYGPLRLLYGRKTGGRGAGYDTAPPGGGAYVPGGRVIVLREPRDGEPLPPDAWRSAETWLRLADGTRVDETPNDAAAAAAQSQVLCSG